MTTTCVMDEYLGAYVLQALERDEDAAVRRHLRECPSCAAEVASLASTASRLALLSIDDVEHALALVPVVDEPSPASIAPPAGTRRVRRALVAVAAALALGGAAGGVMATQGGAPSRPAGMQVVRAVDRTTDVRATVLVAATAAAAPPTALQLSLRGAYPRGTCLLIVHGKDGRTETAASWVATSRGTADVTATTSIPVKDIAAFDVVTSSGSRLVHLPVPAHRS